MTLGEIRKAVERHDIIAVELLARTHIDIPGVRICALLCAAEVHNTTYVQRMRLRFAKTPYRVDVDLVRELVATDISDAIDVELLCMIFESDAREGKSILTSSYTNKYTMHDPCT